MDPTLALALGLSSSPGAYALLLGSGISRAAQIPTGWEVVLDLITKVAALQGEDAAEAARVDTEGWWRSQGHGEPRYDTLLEKLAPSVAARRDLLHAYFEPADVAEREAGVKQPTAAHRAVAELVAAGRIRLILTTNFDRLTETALTEAGVPPQVIARPDAITGMAPLQHARATVIKLHGDYLDVQAIRNTPAELAAYEPAMNDLLARVLDEYGLIVLGWSGEWDAALIQAVENCPTRRYPSYWAAYHGLMSPAASNLLATRAGHLISIDGADAFCTDLNDKVNALARIADPPPTTAIGVATLKRNLTAGRRIELFDQFNSVTGRTLDRLTADRYPVYPVDLRNAPTDQQAAEELGRQLSDYDSDTDVLITLAATAIFHGAETDDLVLRALRRLAEPPRSLGTSISALLAARRYPAHRLATAIGVTAVAAGREALLFRALVETQSRTLEISGEAVALVWALHPWRVFEPASVAGLLPQLANNVGGSMRWPASRYLRASCQLALAGLADEREYRAAFDRYEFLRGMIEVTYGPPYGREAGIGEFVTRNIPAVDEITEGWPLLTTGAFGGDVEVARSAYERLILQIGRQPRF